MTKGKGIIFLKGNLYIYHLHVEADHLGRWLRIITDVPSFPSFLGEVGTLCNVTLNVGFCLRASGNSSVYCSVGYFSQ